MRGKFITLEGVEGSGKSTQALRLARALEAAGETVLSVREPGGTPAAEAVRAILLDPAHVGLAGEVELLLVAAARCDHVVRVIAPALDAGTHVVCDRFSDSTRAYQGGGRGVVADTVEVVDRIARGDLAPDLTLLLDVPAETGLARARRRNADCAAEDEARFEDEEIAFHRRVRSALLRQARREPERIWVIDASGAADDVWQRVRRVVARIFPALRED